MKTISKRIVLSFFKIIVGIVLCCLPFLSACEFFKSDAIITIRDPDNGTSFEDGVPINFAMTFTVYSDSGNVTIHKGTILQWTSNIDGTFWEEVIDHDITGIKESVFSDYSASYSQSFSTSALSVGNHTITCKANVTDASGTQTVASESIRLYITTSQGMSTTTIPPGGGGDGEQSLAECEAMHEIEIYAGKAEYYGTDCYAKIYVNNKSDHYINVISCQYDTHVSEINGCWCSVFAPGVNDYIIDSGWISATMSDGSKRTRKTTVVAATYSTEGCVWICEDLADRVIDVAIPTTNVESMNPCR